MEGVFTAAAYCSALHGFSITCYSVLVQRSEPCQGSLSCLNLHGSAGRDVTDPTPKYTYQSCSFLDKRLFLGSMRDHHLPLPWSELTDPPSWELPVTVPTPACAQPASVEQHVHISDNGSKEGISFLSYTSNFLF